MQMKKKWTAILNGDDTHIYHVRIPHGDRNVCCRQAKEVQRKKNVARKIHTSLFGFNTSEKFNTRKNPVIEYEWIWVVRNSTIDDTALNFFH